jgi:hypothetical protein
MHSFVVHDVLMKFCFNCAYKLTLLFLLFPHPVTASLAPALI